MQLSDKPEYVDYADVTGSFGLFFKNFFLYALNFFFPFLPFFFPFFKSFT